MRGVLFAPGTVGIAPTSARQFGGPIDAIPVGGIVAGKVVEGPGNAHFAEHGEIGGGIGAVGIGAAASPISNPPNPPPILPRSPQRGLPRPPPNLPPPIPPTCIPAFPPPNFHAPVCATPHP